MAENEIPLSEDYDFSNRTDEELAREILITQAIIDQINRMIAENDAQIDLGNEVDGRTRMINVLDAEATIRSAKMTALRAEEARRNI